MRRGGPANGLNEGHTRHRSYDGPVFSDGPDSGGCDSDRFGDCDGDDLASVVSGGGENSLCFRGSLL